MNFVEYCMFVLNFVMYYVVLVRNEMESKFKVIVKYKIIFGVMKNMVNVKLGFSDVYKEFIGYIVNFLNLKFERMKLKEELMGL